MARQLGFVLGVSILFAVGEARPGGCCVRRRLDIHDHRRAALAAAGLVSAASRRTAWRQAGRRVPTSAGRGDVSATAVGHFDRATAIARTARSRSTRPTAVLSRPWRLLAAIALRA
jgi:hypothetical protein